MNKKYFNIPDIITIEDSVKAHFWKETTIEVIENIYFEAFWINMVIPRWFISNWNSFPFFVRAFIDPYDQRFLFAGIFHDYIYWTQFLPRLMADLIYYYILNETAWYIYSNIFYKWLRFWWWKAWNICSKDLQEFPKAKHDLMTHICNLLSKK